MFVWSTPQFRVPFYPLLLAFSALVVGCSDGSQLTQRTAGLVQTCTATNVGGSLYKGTLCGGAFIDNCTPGYLYNCQGGPRGTTNNCTFLQTCAVGCITGTKTTPVTANVGTSNPIADDACYTGPTPLTFSTNDTLGGNYVTMTATLTQSHSPYAVVNFNGTNTIVPPVCSPPMLMMPSETQLSWIQPTGVVSTTTTVPLWTLISFNDSSGVGRNVVSVENPLTLRPGGTLPSPALLSFDVTNSSGTPITTIPGGTNAFARGTLPASTPAPVGGLRVTVTSDPASAFTTDGSFTIQAGCTTNSDWGLLTATSTATSDIPATVTATTAAGSTLSKNVVVTPPPLALQSLTLNPSTVIGGNTVVATIKLNRVVLASDPDSTATVRLSEGLASRTQLATFPGCTGSPACTGPVQVPRGAQSVDLTISTSPVSSQDKITITASATWSRNSPGAQLTINPATSSAPTLSSLVMSPASGACGYSSVGTVALTAAAPAGGAAVTLSSNSSAAQVPASVTVPAGQTQATFTATTGPTCGSSAVITANYGGVSKQHALFFDSTSCTPNCSGKTCGSDGCGGSCGTCGSGQTCSSSGTCVSSTTAVLTVSATGRSGERIVSNPTGISVSSGSTGSATFATGTSITLSASNSRDVVWSGACSSGGQKTKSCTFTLNADASVTGNIQ